MLCACTFALRYCAVYLCALPGVPFWLSMLLSRSLCIVNGLLSSSPPTATVTCLLLSTVIGPFLPELSCDAIDCLSFDCLSVYVFISVRSCSPACLSHVLSLRGGKYSFDSKQHLMALVVTASDMIYPTGHPLTHQCMFTRVWDVTCSTIKRLNCHKLFFFTSKYYKNRQDDEPNIAYVNRKEKHYFIQEYECGVSLTVSLPWTLDGFFLQLMFTKTAPTDLQEFDQNLMKMLRLHNAERKSQPCVFSIEFLLRFIYIC